MARWRVLVLLATASLGACSLGDDNPALEGEVPARESTSSTTTTTASTTTTEPACPELLVGAGNPEQVDAEADVDGDGRADAVSSFLAGDEAPGRRYLLQLALAAGGGAETNISADGDATVALLGGAVLDRPDGRDVLWVRVGAGAATTILGLFHLDGCDLEAATFANGDPVQVPIGGTVGTVSGAECGSGVDPEADLLVHEASHLAGERYEVITTEYRWDHGVLTESPATAPTVSETDDPSEVGGFHCGNLTL